MQNEISNLYGQEEDLSHLEAALAYRFQDRAYLITALTHRSFKHEHAAFSLDNNQRLEFLGDAILGFTIAAQLFQHTPLLTEGQMTKLRAAVVCEEILSEVAVSINLAAYLQLGRGEIQDGGRTKASILADALEAVFAAIFLDGGAKAAEACINILLMPYLELALKGKLSHDYKTRLLEYAQSQTPPLHAAFSIVDSFGPVHNQVYLARAELGELSAEAKGKSKKQAEQAAAKQVLGML